MISGRILMVRYSCYCVVSSNMHLMKFGYELCVEQTYNSTIVLIFWIKNGISEDVDVFLLGNKYCITNGSSAIVFNEEIEAADNEIKSSSFHPSTLDSSDFGCDFDGHCPNIYSWTDYTDWRKVSSLKGPVNDYVTDRRWEALPLIKTVPVNGKGKKLLYYKHNISIKNSSSFVISFSIRGRHNGHMYLCEGDDHPPDSYCYWILLGSHHGGGTFGIRKCRKKEIPFEDKIYPTYPCKELKDQKKNDGALNETSWRHFKIVKERSTLKVMRNNEDFLEFHDDETKSFNPQTIWLHSKDVKILWKIHQYEYLYSDTTGTAQLGPPFRVQDTLCISMFVALCDTCKLQLIIRTGKINVLDKTIDTTHKMWKRVRVTRDISQFKSQMLSFFVSRVNLLHDDMNGFWALDDVRLCSENEYRYIKSEKNDRPCQKIEIGKDIILNNIDNNKIESQGMNCKETSIGKYCVPCQLFSENAEYCSNFEYCEIIDGQEKCHCTPGYEEDCRTSCSNGTYGHGCKKKCSPYCSETGCRYIDGFCKNGCKYDAFTGRMCEIPPEPFIDGKPIVSDIEFTEAKVTLGSYKVVGNTDKPLSIIFQYIRDDDQYNENDSQIPVEQSKNPKLKWVDIGNEISMDDIKVVTIDNLEPDTFYRVRAVIMGNNTRKSKALHENKEFINSTRWKTKCLELSRDEIQIKPANITTNVVVKKQRDTCKLRRYNYTIGRTFTFVKDTFVIYSLDPDKEYNLTIKNIYNGHNFSIPFKTQEGVPSVVRNPSYSSSSSVLHIRWTEPEHKYGSIQYKIRWKYLRKIPCSSIENSSELYEVRNLTSLSLKDLRPYSTYMIIIQAFTTAGLGKPLEVLANTSSNDILTEKEKIYITSLESTANEFFVGLNKINCEDLEGLIYMKFDISCINEWCTLKEINHKFLLYNVNNPQVSIIGELVPFSNYTVQLKVSRNTIDWIETGPKEIRTKPSVPNQITELQAYSKNSKSISLRWKPPYPPTGILQKYQIYYHTKYGLIPYDYYTQVPSTECKCILWPDFHCADINSDIYDDYTYAIKIQAKNKIPLRYGALSEIINVVIRDDAPQPPYGVKFSWRKNNDLNISLFHPNVTNGQLMGFEVILKSDGNQQPIKSYFSLPKYQLIYHFSIESRLLMACTNYYVSICSYNNNFENKYSQYVSYKIISPPDIPLDIPEENIHYNSSNCSITVRMEYRETGLEIYHKTIYIVVSKSDKTEDLFEFTENLKHGTILNLTTSRIVLASIRTNKTKVFTIGQQSKNSSDDTNPPLEPGTNYSISLFFVNECHGVVRLTKMQKFMITTGDPNLHDPENETDKSNNVQESGNGGLWALILLAVIPLVILGYWYKKRGTKLSGKAVGTKDVVFDEIPLTKEINELPSRRVNKVKSRKTLSMQVLPPLNTKYSKKIRLVDFVNYVKTAVESGELESQHDLFPRGLLQKHEHGSLIENKAKNRYKNLIAYDHTRVKLKDIPGEEFSDYINANYIDGYRKPKVYIATQGPKNSTLADFWRMIWQENIKNIVMLANIIENGKKKVEKYWPDINETTNFGDISVKFVSAKVFSNFDLRTFDVFYGREKRQVEQLHFTTWPDHGVPLYAQSLVPFLQRMLKIPYNPSSPILVHCSAGVGRTGTIILCDICLRMAACENAMDFLAYLENLRTQRSNMVDNLEQYKLAHLVVLECLFGMRTAIPCSKDMEQLVETVLQNNGVTQQMRYLEETSWQDSAMETMLERNEVVPACPEKNRFQEIVPDRYGVYLSCYPYNDPTSSYINAILVDDFRNPGRYVVTQQPMPNTLGDFWRLVIERNCMVIINLNKISNKDKTVCKFWPTKDKSMSPTDFLVIRHVSTKRLECYEVTTVLVEIKNTKEELSVDIVSINNWKPGNLLPPNTEEFLTFREAADTISRNSKHVLVTCYDGATASGLYLAMSFLIEKMKIEQECDVCLAVRSIRHSRKHFVTTEEQYEYLFRTSLSFINGFQNYANFD